VKWIDQLAPGRRNINIRRSSEVHFSDEQKKSAVIELCTREGAASSVAEQLGTSRSNLYKLKKELLGERDIEAMKESSGWAAPRDSDAMLAELESLDKQICRKQLELDILTKAVEIAKKAELVNTMLDDAVASLQHGERPIVHTDRGCHYRWPGWVSRIEEAGLTRSTSKKGCSPDNEACEGFFGRIENEMFYGR